MKIIYSIEEYQDDIAKCVDSGADIKVIGKSTLGRDIILLHKGSYDGPQVLVHAGIHAREYLTTPLTMALMSEYSDDIGIYLVPSVNIDGMMLCQYGLSSVDDSDTRKMLYNVNGRSEDFSLWKANANAVDLNVNYNANFGMGKGNVRARASQGYIGEYPLKEVENQILAGITLQIQPKITLSYHTKGNVIYHGYQGRYPYIKSARAIANYINYDLLDSSGSYGGYKDWFVATTPYLGLTIECGDDSLSYPLPRYELNNMIKRQSGLFSIVSRECQKIDRKRYGY